MPSKPTVLITGASRGIGRAAADSLAAAGHRILGLARTKPVDGFPGEFHACDLGDLAQTRAKLQELARAHAILGVVNNVGIVGPNPLESTSIETFDQVIGTTLHPAILAAQVALPAMRKEGWGRIVNITSLSALGVRERSSYSAAKAALATMTRVWALELATEGITVNAVAPGPTVTATFEQNNPPGSLAEQQALERVPMKRLGRPDEIAAAIEFFFSERAGFITGQTLYVDGGASVGKSAS